MEDKSITLTAQEVQQILTELAGRDPVMRFLMQKQAQAAEVQSASTDKPLHVVGGVA